MLLKNFQLFFGLLVNLLVPYFELPQGLKPMDHGVSSDPYVKTHLLPGASKVRFSFFA